MNQMAAMPICGNNLFKKFRLRNERTGGFEAYNVSSGTQVLSSIQIIIWVDLDRFITSKCRQCQMWAIANA